MCFCVLTTLSWKLIIIWSFCLLWYCYRLTISPTPACPQSVCNMFSVSPAAGTIAPSDKPLAVSVCVLPKKELTLTDEPILQCRVIEPRQSSLISGSSISTSVLSTPVIGDAIANIPIRVTCQSSYSRYVLFSFLCTFQFLVISNSNISSWFLNFVQPICCENDKYLLMSKICFHEEKLKLK